MLLPNTDCIQSRGSLPMFHQMGSEERDHKDAYCFKPV